MASDSQTKIDPDKQDLDDIEVNRSLQLIVKGTGILLIGTIIGTILTAMFPIAIARYYTPTEFGIYALAMTVFLFLTQISYLGLDDGCPRNIALYRGRKDSDLVGHVIISTFEFVMISGFIASIILFLSADWISLNLFKTIELARPLRLMSFAVPFWLLIGTIVSIYRGFDRTKESVYFNNLLLNGGKILFALPVIILGLSFDYIFYAIAINIIFVFLVAVIYFERKPPQKIKIKRSKSPVKKELLFFSLPLVFSGMSWFLLQATDKFMIGFSMTEYDVGLYNSACIVSMYLNIFLVSIMFIYQPVGTKLFGAGKNLELKKLYQTITKWVFLIASPLIMLVFLQPEFIISFLFGAEYLGAVVPLSILFLTYTIRICLGPAGGSVIMLGKTKQLMYIVASMAFMNIALNYFLIPIYGITGAAIATGTSVMILSILEAGYLYKISHIQPIKKLYVKIMSIFLFLMAAMYLVFQYMPIQFSMPVKILLTILSYLLFFVLLIVFNLFRKEDLLLIEMVEQKIGRKIPFVRRIIR